MGPGIWDLGSGFSVLGEPRERNLKAAVAEPAAPDAETGVWKSGGGLVGVEVWSSGTFPRASQATDRLLLRWTAGGWPHGVACKDFLHGHAPAPANSDFVGALFPQPAQLHYGV